MRESRPCAHAPPSCGCRLGYLHLPGHALTARRCPPPGNAKHQLGMGRVGMRRPSAVLDGRANQRATRGDPPWDRMDISPSVSVEGKLWSVRGALSSCPKGGAKHATLAVLRSLRS